MLLFLSINARNNSWNGNIVLGALATVIMAPGERIKCILQVQQNATGATIG